MTDAKTPTAREIAEKIAYDEYESWTERIYTDTIVYNGRLADLIEQAIIQARAQALEEAAAAIRALKGAVTMGDENAARAALANGDQTGEQHNEDRPDRRSR